ncbi:MAG: hypothetical protein CMH56_00935 [Myxococcales bacterium]|nr:hypothetical protein [Myxococcales bacterium]
MSLFGSIPTKFFSLLLLFFLTACPRPSLDPIDEDFLENARKNANAQDGGTGDGSSDGQSDGSILQDGGTGDGSISQDAGSSDGSNDGSSDGTTTHDAGSSDGSGNGSSDGTATHDAGSSDGSNDGSGDGTAIHDAGSSDGSGNGSSDGTATHDAGSSDGSGDGNINADAGSSDGSDDGTNTTDAGASNGGEPVNPCEADDPPCDPNATCTANDSVTGFECACNDGYTGDGASCTDVNECDLASDDCMASQTCINTPGSFECQCNPGFYDDPDDGIGTCFPTSDCEIGYGVTAEPTQTEDTQCEPCTQGETYSDVEDDTSPCMPVTGVTCHANADAMPATSSSDSYCQCQTGYTGDGEASGSGCEDVDECDTANGGCEQICNNTAGGHTCSCTSGYELASDQTSCEVTGTSCESGYYFDSETDSCLSVQCDDPSDACALCNAHPNCNQPESYLINVDFGRNEKIKSKRGPAVKCMGEGDYWNLVTQANVGNNAALLSMTTASGEDSGVTMTAHDLTTTVYTMCPETQDVMYSDAMSGIANSDMPSVIQFFDLPPGVWDIFVFTTAGSEQLGPTMDFKSRFEIVLQSKAEGNGNAGPGPVIYESSSLFMNARDGDASSSWVQDTNYLLFEDILVPNAYGTNVVMQRKDSEQIAPLIAGLQLVLKEPINNNDVDGDGFNDDVDLCPVDASDENTEAPCLGSGFDDPCGNGETCTVMLDSVQDGYDSACTGFTQNPCTAGDTCPEVGATCAHVPIGNGTYAYRCVHLCEDVPPPDDGFCPELESCNVGISMQEGFSHVCSGFDTTNTCNVDTDCGEGKDCVEISYNGAYQKYCAQYCEEGPGCDGMDCSEDSVQDLAVGDDFACAITEGGEIQCFGDNIETLQANLGQISNSNFVTIDCSDDTCCAGQLNNANSVAEYNIECFANMPSTTSLTSNTVFLSSGQTLEEIRVNGNTNALYKYRTTEGEADDYVVAFMGPESTNLEEEPANPLFTDSKSFDTNATNACSVNQEGNTVQTLTCMGMSDYGALYSDWSGNPNNSVMQAGYYTGYDINEVALGEGIVCIVGAPENSVDLRTKCWGGDGTNLYDALEVQQGELQDIRVAGNMLCGKEPSEGNRLLCRTIFSTADNSTHTPFQNLEVTRFDHNGTEACVVTTQNVVECKTIISGADLGWSQP